MQSSDLPGTRFNGPVHHQPLLSCAQNALSAGSECRADDRQILPGDFRFPQLLSGCELLNFSETARAAWRDFLPNLHALGVGGRDEASSKHTECDLKA
jgi:hypothetical protein